MWIAQIALPIALFSALILPAQGPSPQEEIKELFRSIEKNLEEIDKLLLEAGTQGSGEKMEEASKKIEELMKKSIDKQQRVSKEIEEILKKIPQTQGDSGSGSSQQNDPESKEQKQEKERERDKTPTDPGQPQSEKPEPKSQQESPAKPKNVKRPPPRAPETKVDPHQNQAGKWGDLPPLYQELFQNQKTDEVPVRYRKQIEEIFRKLNQVNE